MPLRSDRSGCAASPRACLDDLRGGADFAAAAAEHSEDDGTAEAGGDLGFFPRGRMMPPLEEAAFSLPIGELSDPVRTELGFHILRVQERMEAGIKPLEEARQEVIDALQDEKAREAALVFVDDLVVAMDEAPERFAELAGQHGLEVETTPFVEAAGFIEELTGAPQLIGRAFSLRAQTVDAMVGRNGNHYIFQVAETQPDKVPPLEDIVERVTRDARDGKGADLASETGAEWVTQLRDGASLAELAGALELQVTETGLVQAQGAGSRPRQRERVPPRGVSAATQRRRGGRRGRPHLRGPGHRVPRCRYEHLQGRPAGPPPATACSEAKPTGPGVQESLATQYQQLLRDGDLVVNSQYVF